MPPLGQALQGKTALVTGASGAIGRAVALALAERGAALFLSGRDPVRLAETEERVRRAGAAAVGSLAADLAPEGAVEELAGRLEERFGGADVLVHSLGAYAAGPVAETPVTELDRQVAVNLRVPYRLTRRLLPGLIERRGQVVFLGSSAGARPRGGLSAYAASKAALRALADALRDEVNPVGVRVLSIFPGRTASAMQREVHRLEGEAYDPARLLQPADVAAAIVAALELPDSAEVTDLHIRPMRK